jgi:hypothetical protein
MNEPKMLVYAKQEIYYVYNLDIQINAEVSQLKFPEHSSSELK